MEYVDYLFENYRIQIARSEHYEKIRATLSSILLAMAVAMIGFFASKPDLGIVVALCVTGIGWFGYVAATKHSIRARRHGELAGAIRDELSKTFPGYEVIYGSVDRPKTGLNDLWNRLHLLVFLIGIALCLYSAFLMFRTANAT